MAKQLTDKTIQLFYDEAEGLFFYTPSNAEQLIARKKEIFDNVIPASNSQMAINLYQLSKYYYKESYEQLSRNMLQRVMKILESDVSYLSNWAILYFYQAFETVEISIVGENAKTLAQQFDEKMFFNKVIAGSSGSSDIPILAERSIKQGKDTIYVCYNKSCKLPVHTVEEAIKLIQFEPGRP